MVLGHSPVLPRAEGAPVAGCWLPCPAPPPAPACFSPPRCSRGPPCRPGRWVGLRSVGDLTSTRPAPPECLRTTLGRSHLLLPDPTPDPGPMDPQGPTHACASLRACGAGPSVYPQTRRGTHRRTIKQGDASRPAGHLAAVPPPPFLPPPPPALHRPPEQEMNQLTAGCWSTAGRGG